MCTCNYPSFLIVNLTIWMCIRINSNMSLGFLFQEASYLDLLLVFKLKPSEFAGLFSWSQAELKVRNNSLIHRVQAIINQTSMPHHVVRVWATRVSVSVCVFVWACVQVWWRIHLLIELFRSIVFAFFLVSVLFIYHYRQKQWKFES